MQPIIEIEVGPDGQASIDAIGFVGETCKVATKPFEDIYKQEVFRKVKSEMHLTAGSTISQDVSK